MWLTGSAFYTDETLEKAKKEIDGFVGGLKK